MTEAPEMEDRDLPIRARVAVFIARNPRTIIFSTLGVSLILCMIDVLYGNINVDMENRGWKSRGTNISERGMQSSVFKKYRIDLFNDEDGELWDYVTTTTLDGYTDIGLAAPIDTEIKIQSNTTSNETIPSQCDPSWYTSTWPGPGLKGDNMNAIWKPVAGKSALDPEVIFEICEMEQAIVDILSRQSNLCDPCNGGKCLNPSSLISLIRNFTNQDDMEMGCEELVNIYKNIQPSFNSALQRCVEDFRANFDPNSPDGAENITQCSPHFRPFMVDYEFLVFDNFDVVYTASSFPIPGERSEKESLLFELRDLFPRTDSSILTGRYEMNLEVFYAQYIGKVLLHDIVFAFISSAVTIIAIIIHTKSPWLTLFGLLQILISIPWAYFFYHFVVGLSFFPVLNLIALFISAALGADDLFVACDKWKNSRIQNPMASTEEIAIMTLPDAAGAMLLTTATTFVAFIGTTVCPVAPIYCFAVFCGLTVAFNYVLNCTFVFPALCIYDKWLQNGMEHWLIAFKPKTHNLSEDKNSEEQVQQSSNDRENQDMNSNVSLIHRILLRLYRFIHKFSVPLLVIFSTVTCVSVVFGSKIPQPEDNLVRLLPPNNEYEEFHQWSLRLLENQILYDRGTMVDIFWGLQRGDTGAINNPDTLSKLNLDSGFEPSSIDAQIYLMDFCNRIYQNEFAKRPYSEYECSMNRFNNWLNLQSSLPIGEQATDFMKFCNGATSLPMNEDDFHACIIYYSKEKLDTMIVSNAKAGKVKIIQDIVLSTARLSSNYTVLDTEYNKFEKYVLSERSTAPEGVDNFFHSSSTWWWYDTVTRIQSAALTAAAIAIGFSAGLVLIVSRSFLLTVFSGVCILFVLAITAATLVGIFSWTLGFLESICFSILIGISCDFVIHLGHSYSRIPGTVDRNERTKNALIHMGPSILAAALTTFTSAIFMLFCEIKFFPLFASILLFTIVYAVIASMIYYIVLSDLFGPSEPTKGVDRILRCICARRNTS
jgi:5-methyltetrahydrofolate--homocysteine methyltransferase